MTKTSMAAENTSARSASDHRNGSFKMDGLHHLALADDQFYSLFTYLRLYAAVSSDHLLLVPEFGRDYQVTLACMNTTPMILDPIIELTP